MQFAKACDLRGLAHEHQRGAGKASICQAIEGSSQVLYEVGLAFTVLPTIDFSLRAAISGGIDCRVPGSEGHDHGSVKIFRQSIQFNHVGDRLQSGNG